MKAMRSSRKITSIQKAAVFLLSLPEEKRQALFKKLDAGEREAVVKAISEVRMVDADEKQNVLKEFFHAIATVRGGVVGGDEKVVALLNSTLSRAEASEYIAKLKLGNQEADIAHTLRTVDMEQLSNFLHNEQPQTIALILSVLDPGQAAEVLSGVDDEQKSEVIIRMATMGHTAPEIIAQVGSVVKKQLATSIGKELKSAGGVQQVANILNFVDRNSEKNIMMMLDEKDKSLAEEIKKMMFVFDDLVNVEDRSMQRILKEVDTSELALALKTASEEVQEKVYKNISKRAVELIKEEIEYMGPVRVKDVEDAQQRIVNVVRRLEEEGEVMISGRGGGGGDEFV